MANILPAEMLEKIFCLLPPRDLKTAVLVCRRWREVGEEPGLWAWAFLRLAREDLSLQEALDTRRLQAVRRWRVEDLEEKLLQGLLELRGLKELEIKLDSRTSRMSLVDLGLLARVVSRMEKVKIFPRSLGSKQATQAIFEAINDSAIIRKVKISGNNLSRVEAGLLARCVCKLEEAELSVTFITPQQAEDIFISICQDGSKLRKLTIVNKSVSTVNSTLMAKAISKLEEVNLNYSFLNSQQSQAIFSALNECTNLKILEIGGNDLSAIEPNLIAKSITKLKEVRLNYTSLTSQQAEAIFTAINGGESKLQKLDLGGNLLASVEPYILARAVARLEVGLYNTSLTSLQTVAVRGTEAINRVTKLVRHQLFSNKTQ